VKSTLSDILITARTRQGWSLQEASELLGCSKQHLHSLETKGTDNPSLKLLAKIVIVYGIRPEALIATAILENVK